MSDEDIEKAGLRDKAVAAGIFTDKHLLLSRQPTEIVSMEDRRHLDELASELLKEAVRGGYDIHRDPVTGEVRLERAVTPAAPRPPRA